MAKFSKVLKTALLEKRDTLNFIQGRLETAIANHDYDLACSMIGKLDVVIRELHMIIKLH